jgi:lysophospholipase L1-like esterase
MKSIPRILCLLAVAGAMGTSVPAEIAQGTISSKDWASLKKEIPGVKAIPAPKPDRTPWLQKGDRLAICGDSITEQKMYSRIIENYLVMCIPELEIRVRQYGWSGERAPGFLARMTNDCLRFQPTVATTCYGMNDHQYRAYEEPIGAAYLASSKAVVEAFQAHGVRVLQGSPGCVGKMPGWIKMVSNTNTIRELNANLARLRNLGLELAQEKKLRFADVFGPMLLAMVKGHALYGTNYAIPGSDGVHPAWAGQMVMAYAFLSEMGLDGQIASLNLDAKTGAATLSPGHRVISSKPGTWEIQSRKYPFCLCAPEGKSYPVCGKEDLKSHDSIRSVLAMLPFNEELNRFELQVGNLKRGNYEVNWGGAKKVFSSTQLKRGINLAAEFPENPFCAAFGRVNQAVLAKQAFETEQIKKRFRSPEAKANMEAVVKETEAQREPLVQAIGEAFQPVTHRITITPVKG